MGRRAYPSMTRAHFQFIADSLRYTKPEAGNYDTLAEYRIAYAQWRITVTNMASDLRLTNGLYQKDKFLRAAGIEE